MEKEASDKETLLKIVKLDLTLPYVRVTRRLVIA